MVAPANFQPGYRAALGIANDAKFIRVVGVGDAASQYGIYIDGGKTDVGVTHGIEITQERRTSRSRSSRSPVPATSGYAAEQPRLHVQPQHILSGQHVRS